MTCDSRLLARLIGATIPIILPCISISESDRRGVHLSPPLTLKQAQEIGLIYSFYLDMILNGLKQV